MQKNPGFQASSIGKLLGGLSVRTSSGKETAGALLDGNSQSLWHSDGNERQRLDFDLGGVYPIGALSINWGTDNFKNNDVARRFDVYARVDGKYTKVYAFSAYPDFATHIYIQPVLADKLRIVLRQSNRGSGYGIRGVDIMAAMVGNQFFNLVASTAQPGLYPEHLNGSVMNLLPVGVDFMECPSTMNAYGIVGFNSGDDAFSIEPFIRLREDFLGWARADHWKTTEGALHPVSTVFRLHEKVTLSTTTFKGGSDKDPVVYVRYRVKNISDKRISGKLFATVRPFQNNAHALGESCHAPIKSLKKLAGNRVIVNDKTAIVPLTGPAPFGATTFDGGDISAHLSRNLFPTSTSVKDRFGFASGAFGFLIGLEPDEECDYYLAVRGKSSRKKVVDPEIALHRKQLAAWRAARPTAPSK